MHETPLVMPKMSMTMTEGELVAWHIKEGDTVEAGQIVCEVATDKVDMDVEAPAAGTVTRLLAEPGATIPVGEPLAQISGETEDLLAGLLAPAPDAPPPAESESTEPAEPIRPAEPDAPAEVPHPARVLALPGARRRAAANGVRLDLITGSGPGGVITFRDVEKAGGAASGPAPALAPKEAAEDEVRRRRRGVRAKYVERLLESTAIPQSTIWRELDLDGLAQRRAGLSWTTLLLRALATALRDTPELAAERPEVVLTVAVDSVHGQLAVSFTDPDLGPVDGVDAEVRRTVDRARRGRIDPSHLVPGTVGLVNLGPLGADRLTTPVTPPHAAVLTVGAVGERVAVTGGGMRIRTGCTVGLTVDHRVADSADGARLLRALAFAVSDPDRLLRPPAG